MKFRFFFLIISSLFVSKLFAQDAKEIIKKAEDNAKGKTSIAEIVIQTERPTWTREMTVKAWTKGNDLTLILIKSPEKEKGVVFLKQKKEVWNWIPSIERNIKLPPSMMSQSWMGTDFTNDGQHDVFSSDTGIEFAIHTDEHVFHLFLHQTLRGQHMFNF